MALTTPKFQVCALKPLTKNHINIIEERVADNENKQILKDDELTLLLLCSAVTARAKAIRSNTNTATSNSVEAMTNELRPRNVATLSLSTHKVPEKVKNVDSRA